MSTRDPLPALAEVVASFERMADRNEAACHALIAEMNGPCDCPACASLLHQD